MSSLFFMIQVRERCMNWSSLAAQSILSKRGWEHVVYQILVSDLAVAGNGFIKFKVWYGALNVRDGGLWSVDKCKLVVREFVSDDPELYL